MSLRFFFFFWQKPIQSLFCVTQDFEVRLVIIYQPNNNHWKILSKFKISLTVWSKFKMVHWFVSLQYLWQEIRQGMTSWCVCALYIKNLEQACWVNVETMLRPNLSQRYKYPPFKGHQLAHLRGSGRLSRNTSSSSELSVSASSNSESLSLLGGEPFLPLGVLRVSSSR